MSTNILLILVICYFVSWFIVLLCGLYKNEKETTADITLHSKQTVAQAIQAAHNKPLPLKANVREMSCISCGVHILVNTIGYPEERCEACAQAATKRVIAYRQEEDDRRINSQPTRNQYLTYGSLASCKSCNEIMLVNFNGNITDQCGSCNRAALQALRGQYPVVNDTQSDYNTGMNNNTIYTNGAFGDLRTDPVWDIIMAESNNFVPPQIHSEAQRIHQSMTNEQLRQRNAAIEMVQRFADGQSPPKSKKEILEDIIVKEPVPTLRRIKV